ncbi:heparinase II/III family protein [Clostridium lacusfryxellense]|uniref:heparinase II/III family protein n=1 Tax=Clostridium lacusfryxellense TaxID=205328 RepID=UPI001C0B24CD|nr:heparinase II/III family protein [Clostridium lacusfryxellense]MBU3113294.1 hypothetical protein [Clostridium lacusfryxellense]
MFIIDDYINCEGLMIIKEAPTALSAINRKCNDLFIKPGENVQLIGTGIDYTKLSIDYYTPCYGSTIGDVQCTISRKKTEAGIIAFAAKGGHNEEHHNHSDIGNFILNVNGDSLIADLGMGKSLMV